MTDLEDRIRTGLRTDRVVPDLWDAVQEGARRRRARRTLAVASAATAMVALVAALTGYLGAGHDVAPTPQPIELPNDQRPPLDPADWEQPQAQFLAGVTPEPADVVGLWRIRSSGHAWLMLLGADGYWTTTSGWDLFGHDDLGNRGRYTLDHGTLVNHGRQGFCGKDWTGGQQVVLMPDGSLHFLVRPDEIGVRPRGGVCKPAAGDRMIWDRVAPGDSRLLDSLPAEDQTTLDAAAADSFLPGVWASADGHWVITIDEQHRFRAFHDRGDPTAAADDTGRLVVDDRGQLTMTCRGGRASGGVTLGVTAEVPGLLRHTVRMHGTGDSSCTSGLGATYDWIRVSENA